MNRATCVMALLLTANPAFAHHEAVVATSLIPMAAVAATVSAGAIAAWFRARSKK